MKRRQEPVHSIFDRCNSVLAVPLVLLPRVPHLPLWKRRMDMQTQQPPRGITGARRLGYASTECPNWRSAPSIADRDMPREVELETLILERSVRRQRGNGIQLGSDVKDSE
jgi:hypothetical protein